MCSHQKWGGKVWCALYVWRCTKQFSWKMNDNPRLQQLCVLFTRRSCCSANNRLYNIIKSMKIFGATNQIPCNDWKIWVNVSKIDFYFGWDKNSKVHVCMTETEAALWNQTSISNTSHSNLGCTIPKKNFSPVSPWFCSTCVPELQRTHCQFCSTAGEHLHLLFFCP